MVFQTLDEIKAQLLIEPDLEIDSFNLGDNLYFLELQRKNILPDLINEAPDVFLKLPTTHFWVMELKSKEDILNLLYDGNFYFDYMKHSKKFRFKSL